MTWEDLDENQRLELLLKAFLYGALVKYKGENWETVGKITLVRKISDGFIFEINGHGSFRVENLRVSE